VAVAAGRGAGAGRPTDARGDLSLRAHRLISLRTRQRLPAEIRQVLRDAARAQYRFERCLVQALSALTPRQSDC
jgi:hypothetical protein